MYHEVHTEDTPLTEGEVSAAKGQIRRGVIALHTTRALFVICLLFFLTSCLVAAGRSFQSMSPTQCDCKQQLAEAQETIQKYQTLISQLESSLLGCARDSEVDFEQPPQVIAVSHSPIPIPTPTKSQSVQLTASSSSSINDMELITKNNAVIYKQRLEASTDCNGKNNRGFVTLCTAAKYVPGIMTLALALKELNSTYPLIVMITPGNCLAVGPILDMRSTGAKICIVNHIDNPKPLHEGHYLADTYSKLNLFALPLKLAVFLDSDVLPLTNIDDYFDKLPEDRLIGSSSDCGHGSRFYSGLMIVRPDRVDFADMISKVGVLSSDDGGDLGFLNQFFLGSTDVRSQEAERKGFFAIAETDHWVRSKFCSKTKANSVLPVWVEQGNYTGSQLQKEEAAINAHLHEIRVIHYPGYNKPWWTCTDSKNCDTGMGRGPSLDRLYMQTMERLGLVGSTGVVGVGRTVFRSGDDLSIDVVRTKCPKFDGKGVEYHNAVLCGGGERGNSELRDSLANLLWGECSAGCVYSRTEPLRVAWRWDSNCWREEFGNVDEFGQLREGVIQPQCFSGRDLNALRDIVMEVLGGKMLGSPLYHMPLGDICEWKRT